jgi:hypothetical protein
LGQRVDLIVVAVGEREQLGDEAIQPCGTPTSGFPLLAKEAICAAPSPWLAARCENGSGLAVRTETSHFFIISQAPNDRGGPTVSIHENSIKHDPAAELTITINLSQIFARV